MTAKKTTAKQSEPNPLELHKAAYQAHIDAQEALKQTMLNLEDARRGAIAHLAERLAEIEGVDDRLSDTSGSTDDSAGLLLLSQDADPIEAFVKATESRYFQALGREAEHPPLAIFHVNSWDGSELKCPSCGTVITRDTPAPEGTLGRGG